MAVIVGLQLVWAAIQLAPVGPGRAVHAGALDEQGAALRHGLERAEPGAYPALDSALESVKTRLGTSVKRPTVYVAVNKAFVSAYASPDRRHPSSVLTQGAVELPSVQLDALAIWLTIRCSAGGADWWNEDAVRAAVDQSTLHAIGSAESLTRLLKATETAELFDVETARSLGLTSFVGRRADTKRRIAALEGSVFSGEWVADPLAWDDSIPAPVQMMLDEDGSSSRRG
jgi:hypothetical protein